MGLGLVDVGFRVCGFRAYVDVVKVCFGFMESFRWAVSRCSLKGAHVHINMSYNLNSLYSRYPIVSTVKLPFKEFRL